MGAMADLWVVVCVVLVAVVSGDEDSHHGGPVMSLSELRNIRFAPDDSSRRRETEDYVAPVLHRMTCDGPSCREDLFPTIVDCNNTADGGAPWWHCHAMMPEEAETSYYFTMLNISCEPSGDLDELLIFYDTCTLFYSVDYLAPWGQKFGLALLICVIFFFMFISYCPKKYMLNSGGTYDSYYVRDAPNIQINQPLFRDLRHRRLGATNTYPIDCPIGDMG